jgi:hypothetical protein
MAEPPVTLMAAHTSGPLAMPVTRIVIHATCPSVGYPAASAPGAALGTARYFAQAGSGGSAHYVEDPTTEAHCVPDNITGWHAPPNGNSIGIEICAEGGDYALSYTRDQWLSPQVWPAVQRAAARTRELCERFGVPMTKVDAAGLLNGAHGICGHVDVSQAWHQSSHSDPGPQFPWPEFLAEVNNTGDPFMALTDAQQVAMATSVGKIEYAILSLVKPSTDQIPALIASLDKLTAAINKIQAGGTVSVQAVADQLTVVPKP